MPWAFGPAPLATVARLWYPLCGQGPLNANTDTSAQAARMCPSKTAEVHYRPSTVGRSKQCDLGHMVACTGQSELVSHLVRMMDGMGRSKRPSSPRVKQAQPDRQPPAEPPSPAQQVSRMSPSQVLERIKRVQIARQEAEAELAALIDYAVGLGIGWPEIADWLGVTRQAARQHYQRRHRGDAHRRDRGPD
jgi:hypothetical protein